MTTRHDRFFVWCFALLFIWSCEDIKSIMDEPLYEGPTVSMDSVFTKISDSAIVVMTLKAPKQDNFENGDREWPKSLELRYLDKYGVVQSTFRADYVFYSSKEDLYRAEGNVVVKNLESNDELNTEELFYDPVKEEFYTERFVTIQSEDGITYGEGMRAPQDFKTYRIFKITGEGDLLED